MDGFFVGLSLCRGVRAKQIKISAIHKKQAMAIDFGSEFLMSIRPFLFYIDFGC